MKFSLIATMAVCHEGLRMSKISSEGFRPLFNDKSTDTISPAFTVGIGQVAILQAYGFLDTNQSLDPDEYIPQKQVACVQKLFYENGPLPQGVACGGIIPTGVSASSGYDYVKSCKVGWEMSSCNNVAMINVPGTYRLELNDQTALGTVSIYYTIVTAGAFPWNSNLFFGELQ